MTTLLGSFLEAGSSAVRPGDRECPMEREMLEVDEEEDVLKSKGIAMGAKPSQEEVEEHERTCPSETGANTV